MKYSKEDPKAIEALFDNIATHYDKANALMSLNLHKYWNNKLSSIVFENSSLNAYLDLCSGTGEIAFTGLKRAHNPCNAYLLDFSEKMLACAREKEAKLHLKKHHVHYLHADAQHIPLPNSSVDAVTIAYGIRNVKDPGLCMKEVHRVLKKGGLFAILELTQPKNPIVKAGHALYMKLFLPIVGKWIASDKEAYQYLCGSIQSFLPPKDLERLLLAQGFRQTSIILLNFGIATIITGRK